MYDLPKLNQKYINNLNRSTMSNYLESVKNNFPTKKSPVPDGFIAEFYQTFKVELAPMFLKILQETKREQMLPKSSHEASVTLISKLCESKRNKGVD
jgi:hypothetical protein